MTKNQIKSLVSTFLSKQAEESSAHEAAETPGVEAVEHATGVEGGAPEGDMDVEKILAQLSPEELQELLAQLAQEHPEAMAGADAGGDDVEGLSQGIESSLAANPEAQVPGLPPEKAAALNFVKSANYIEGFIKQALDRGLDTSEAVNMYDQALTTTVYQLKEAALALPYSKKPSFLKKLKDGTANHLNKYKGEYAAGAAGAAAGYAAGKAGKDDKEKEKKAAFLTGVYKQAIARGYSEDDALEITKEAAGKPLGLPSSKKPSFLKKLKDSTADHFDKHKGKYMSGAAGAAAGYAAGKAGKDKKEKKAAFLTGVYKQAIARGYSEDDALAVISSLENSLG